MYKKSVANTFEPEFCFDINDLKFDFSQKNCHNMKFCIEPEGKEFDQKIKT